MATLTLTHVSGCKSDFPHLSHRFSIQNIYCVGSDYTNQNMNSVTQSGGFVVVFIILQYFTDRIELENNVK